MAKRDVGPVPEAISTTNGRDEGIRPRTGQSKTIKDE
jgi:hypothetical protein